MNGEDILGKKIIQVAEKIKMNSLNNENGVTLLLWNSGSEQVNGFNHVSIYINNLYGTESASSMKNKRFYIILYF